ncbi:hypothetical protein LJC27_07255, partial [Christensenellaceae bacterium OttesenSCG-928-M15]|nr:hypothetical protein [Christensenellaceae bacterium OttesenSCG-928-M15]
MSQYFEMEKFPQEVRYFLEAAIMKAADVGATEVTVPLLLLPLFMDVSAHEHKVREAVVRIVTIVQGHFTAGVTQAGCLEVFEELVPREQGAAPDYFDFSCWDEHAKKAVSDPARYQNGAEYILALFEQVDTLLELEKETVQTLLDVDAIKGALKRYDSAETAQLFLEDQTLNRNIFTQRMEAMIEQSLAIATETGHPTVKTLHLFYAMLKDKDAYTAIVARRVRADATPSGLRTKLKTRLTRGESNSSKKL